MSEIEQETKELEKKDIIFRFENNPNKYVLQIDFSQNSPSLEEQQKKYLEVKSEELKFQIIACTVYLKLIQVYLLQKKLI